MNPKFRKEVTYIKEINVENNKLIVSYAENSKEESKAISDFN